MKKRIPPMKQVIEDQYWRIAYAAMEFGYVECEKCHNIQLARINLRKLMIQTKVISRRTR